MSQRKKKRSRYYCNCYYCTGTTKAELINKKEKLVNSEMENQIKDYDTNN